MSRELTASYPEGPEGEVGRARLVFSSYCALQLAEVGGCVSAFFSNFRKVRFPQGRLAVVTLLILAPAVGFAIEMDGAATIRLIDGTGSGECIDSSKDAVSLHLRRLIIKRNAGFFTADSQIAVVLETRLQALSAVERETTIVTYPRVFRTSVNDYAGGLVSLPVEVRILTRFPLSQASMDTAGIDLDFSAVRKKGNGTFGLAIEHLARLSESLVPPANPYGKAFGYFADYAKGVVDASIADKNIIDGELKEGRLALTFSDNQSCEGDEERTGTIAVVQAHEGTIPNGVVSIATPEAYCWRSRFEPIFSVEVASKPSGGCELVSQFRSLQNPHYMFVLNASRQSRTEAFSSGSKRLDDDAHQRCRAHKIPLAEC
jgi:hypothetical protein